MRANIILLVGGAATVAVAQESSATSGAASSTGTVTGTPTIALPTSYIFPGPSSITGSPCLSLYSKFFEHTELAVPSVLGDWLAESTKKYFETHIPTPTSSFIDLNDPDNNEYLNDICFSRIAERTLTDLPAPVATVYSSFTSQWSSFVATAKTEASSIASVCLCAGATFHATHILDAVVTAQTDCWANWRLAYPLPYMTSIVCSGSSATPSGSIVTITSSSRSNTTTTATTSSTSSTSSIPTGGAARETGYAIAAVVAVAGVVGLL